MRGSSGSLAGTPLRERRCAAGLAGGVVEVCAEREAAPKQVIKPNSNIRYNMT
jgi:hypothetical protein